MAEVRATLQLESSDALSTVDALGTGLDAVVSNFQLSFDAAIAAIEPQIAAIGAAGIGESIVADPTQAITALQEVDTAATATTSGLTDLGVAGSTALDDVATAGSNAGSALDNVQSSSAAAAEGMSGLAGGTAGLTGALAAAKGEGAGVVEALGGLEVISGGTAAAVTAGAAALGAFFEAGVKAESASQRLKLAFGDEAETVKRINIGGLTGNLDELAQKVGTTTAQLDNGIARLGEYGKTAGFTAQQTVQTTQQISALALRAVALNPALGSVDQVIQQMSRSLGTGGARAQQFYIQLNKQDILVQAIKMFGGVAAALTPFEKSAAAAQLEVEKLGGTLGKDFTQGADTADNKLKALKATIENAFEKTGTGLVASLTDLLNAALPVATTFISVLGPALTGVAAALSALRPILPAVVTGFIAFEVVTKVIPGIMDVAAGAIEVLGTTFQFSATAAETAAGGIAGASAVIEESAGAIGLIIAVAGLAASALGLFGRSAQETKTDLNALGKEGDVAFTKMAENLAILQAAGKQDGGLLNVVAVNATKKALSDLQGLSDQNTGAALRLGAAYVTAGDITEKQFNTAIRNGIKAQKDAAVAATQAASGISQLSAAQQTEVFIANAATAAAKDKDKVYSASITTYNALIAAGIASGTATQAEATAYATATQAASDYKTALDVLGGAHLTEFQAATNYAKSIANVANTWDTTTGSISTATKVGQDNRDALAKAVTDAEAYATAVRGVGGSTEEANSKLRDLGHSIETMALASNQSPADIAKLLGSLGLLVPSAEAGITTIDDLNSAIATIGPGGTTAAANLKDTLVPGVADATKSATQQALENVNPSVFKLPEAMATVGYDSGSNLGTAMAHGITDNIHWATEAADALGTAAADAVRKALGIKSPSQVFMDIGDQMAQGLAIGLSAGGRDVVDAATAIAHAAAATSVPVGAGIGGSSGGSGSSTGGASRSGGPSQTNNFYGYSPQETAAVNGREWTRLTRFSGGG